VLIVFSRAIFYFVDFAKLKEFIVTLFASSHPINVGFVGDITGFSFFFVLVVLFCIPWQEIYPPESRLHQKCQRLYAASAPVLNLLMLALCTVLLADDTYNPFIYFRF
jgi:alginate O-acetyltransferase complex protein AlgI